MKSTFKLSSLIGSLLVALAITMFIPSASQATWGNYSSNDSSSSSKSKKCDTKKSTKHYKKKSSSSSSSSKSSSSNNSSNSNGNGDSEKCKKYEKLAAKYLKAYYKCYKYSYYKKYLYYTKKAKACKPAVTVNCDKYKVLADKYLAAYNKCGYSCYYKYYKYYMNLYNKCQANLDQTGKVCGKVFEDTNENGELDSEDARLGNVTVNITDSKGKVTTVTTNNDGYYCASNITTGTASVDIDESTLPDNPTQVVGTDPTDVEVDANTNNWEENNGYTFPVPTGNVCGTVYEDKNGNGEQDADEKGEADIDVTIIDASGTTYTVVTDVDGKYCQSDVPEGSASVTVVESTLPDGATLTAGENPSDVTVVAGENNDAGTDGYTLPTPVGNACGVVIVDGQGQANVTVNLLDSEGITHTETTDNTGKYCFKNIPEGDATVDIDDSTLPAGAELTAGEDPSDVTIVPNTNNDAGTDAYTLPIPVGSACGQVVVDGQGQENVTLNLTDANDDVRTVTTDADGKWCAKGLVEGDVTVDVDETTLPEGVKRVLGEDQDTYTVVTGENTDAGIDGYESLPTGNVCGIVFEDQNKNTRITFGEPRIPNISVSITDSLGNIHIAETDADGKYCASGITEGIATVDVDENDIDMPANSEETTNSDPSTVNVIANQDNDAGIDGYFNPNATHSYLCVTVFEDTDHSGNYTVGDIVIPNIEVTFIDSEGNTHILETKQNGVAGLNLPLGLTTISIDINDLDMPVGLVQTVGSTPIDTENILETHVSLYLGFDIVENTP